MFSGELARLLLASQFRLLPVSQYQHSYITPGCNSAGTMVCMLCYKDFHTCMEKGRGVCYIICYIIPPPRESLSSNFEDAFLPFLLMSSNCGISCIATVLLQWRLFDFVSQRMPFKSLQTLKGKCWHWWSLQLIPSRDYTLCFLSLKKTGMIKLSFSLTIQSAYFILTVTAANEKQN